MIGEPSKDVGEAMRREHCEVHSGFGASDVELVSDNYSVRFTPRGEYDFVAIGNQALPAGYDPDGAKLPDRAPIRIASLLAQAFPRIRASMVKLDCDMSVLTQDAWDALQITQEELIALRLYTGPMFKVYNTILRAMATGGIIPSYMTGGGQNVRGYYTTTLHAINSGVIKLSRLQPAAVVYRGIKGMKLPKAFAVTNAHNFRGGVEYGFLSTTLDKEVALQYARGGDNSGKRNKTPGLLFEIRMGMVDRGALLSWLSQYPKEEEILFPPLTGLEVLGEFIDGATLCTRMRANINLQSKTIEELLAVRKRHFMEMLQLVQRDLRAKDDGSIFMKRQQKLSTEVHSRISAHGRDWFNVNENFTQGLQTIASLMPKAGDLDGTYHVFIGYRTSEQEVATQLYKILKGMDLGAGRKLRPFLYHMEGEHLLGKRWDEVCLEALAHSLVFLPIISLGCVERMVAYTAEQPARQDNVLLEWQLALEFVRTGTLQAICPLYWSRQQVTFFEQMEQLENMPQIVHAETTAIAKAFVKKLNGSDRLHEELTVAETFDVMIKYQGINASNLAELKPAAASIRTNVLVPLLPGSCQ
jgi:hypothetical protein